MYIIRQYEDLLKQETFKEVKQTKDRYSAKIEMLKLADSEVNNSWILWQVDGENEIKLQTISNTF